MNRPHTPSWLAALLLFAVGVGQPGCMTTTLSRGQLEAVDFGDPVSNLVAAPFVIAESTLLLGGLLGVAPIALVTIPFVEYDQRAADAARARTEAAWARPAHLVNASMGLVVTELRFHLPPSARGVAARERVRIATKGGGPFSRKTFEIVAVGAFTPARLKKFLEAAERLHGHLDSAPLFRLQVYDDAGGTLSLVGVYEFS